MAFKLTKESKATPARRGSVKTKTWKNAALTLIETGKAGVVDNIVEKEMVRQAVRSLNCNKRLTSEKLDGGKYKVWVIDCEGKAN